MKVDVVVCRYQQEQWWPFVREGLARNAEMINRVIVVEDEVPKDMSDYWVPVPDVETVFLDHVHEGFGLAKSANQGLAAATTEFVLLIEGDEILPRGSVLQTRSRAFAGRLLCAPKAYTGFPLDETPVSSIDDFRLLDEKDHRLNPLFQKRARQGREWLNCSGGHLLIHRASHEAIGGFDERYGYGLHDYDYAARWLLKHGPKSVVFDPMAGTIWHIGSGKGRTMPSPASQLLFAAALAPLYGNRFHLGCDVDFNPAYVNVDHLGTSATDAIADCLSLAFIADEGASEIKSRHFLEHLALPQAERHLEICFQKLAPGGQLDIVVPDVMKCVLRLMAQHSRDGLLDWDAMQGLYGDQQKQASNLSQLHRWGWTDSSLRATLEKLGFEVDFVGEDDTATFARWRDTRIMATKPEAEEEATQ